MPKNYDELEIIKTMKKLFTSLSIFMVTSLMAQTVSVDVAKQKAEAFIRQDAGTRASLSLTHSYTSAQGDETYYYVFNKGDEQGFIIMGGDEAAQEILGYSDKGAFDYDKIPDNMRWWLSQYDLQISHAIREVKAGRLVVSKDVRTRAEGRSDVGPLLKTEWNQDAPYNSQIPTYGGDFIGNYALATGCVATAGAQVMKYHNWPDTGVGSKTLSVKYNGLIFSADFGATTYDWSNMCDTYESDTYTGSVADIAVGTLMYHVGVATDMKYGQIRNGGSGTATTNLGLALINNFKYDKSMVYEQRQDYTDSEWEDMVYNELRADRPVIYDGRKLQENGTTTGHCFVCDGYKASDNTFYINWGWGGLSNGPYKLTGTGALLPAHQGAGSGDGTGDGSYSLEQAALFGVKPDQGGTPVINISKSCDYVLSAATVSAGNSITITSTDTKIPFCVNHSFGVPNFTMGFRFKSSSNEYDISIGNQNLSLNTGPVSRSFKIPAFIVADTYKVIPIYVDAAGDWREVKGDHSSAPTLSVTEPEGVAIYDPIVVRNEGYASSSDLNVTFSLKNFSDAQITKKFIIWIFPANGGDSVDYFDLGNITLAAGEEIEFDLGYSDLWFVKNRKDNKLESGSDYFMQLKNYTDNQYISDPIDLYFRDSNPITYELTSAGWGTICLPYEAEVPAGLSAYCVTDANAGVLELTEVSEIEMNKPYLLQGTAGTYDFSGPETPVGTFKNGLLTGSTESDVFYAPKGSYVLQNQAGKGVGFYEVKDDDKQKVKKYRAFLNITSSSNSFSLGEGSDGTTSLEQINSFEAQDLKAYDMFGHPVDPNTKGMIIINGEKRINL